MQTPIIKINQLTKVVKNKRIIDRLSFEVFPGEVFGFLGPNGAGKTTTIRMIVGLISITSGTVMIKGKSISKEFEEAIKEIGAIVENPEMYKFLTGYENLIHYKRMVSGVSNERIDEVVALVGLTEKIHEKVRTYSLGMRQRLGLAQALLHSPSVLILDEPTNGLDPAGIRDIRDHLRKLAQTENLAVIVSSHLLAEMELMCDRIGIIQNGQLIGVQAVSDFISGEASFVSLQVDDGYKAEEILKIRFPNTPFTRDKEQIDIKMEKEEVPLLNEALVMEKIKVYQIIVRAKSLEEKFLELTGGENVG